MSVWFSSGNWPYGEKIFWQYFVFPFFNGFKSTLLIIISFFKLSIEETRLQVVLNPYGWHLKHSIAARKSKGLDFKNCHLKLKKNVFYNKKISVQVEAMEAIISLRGQRILTTTIQMWFLGETVLDYCIMLAFMDQVTANYPIVALFAYHCLIVFSSTAKQLHSSKSIKVNRS